MSGDVTMRRSADIALLSSYPPPYGGAATHVQRLMPRLSAHRIRFTVYNAVSSSDCPPTVTSVARWRRLWLLSYLFRGHEPVVYVFSDRLAVWVGAALLAVFRGKRVIIRLRNAKLQKWLERSRWRGRIAGWALRRATGVVCVSRALADSAKSAGVDPERIVELPGFLPPDYVAGDRTGVSPSVFEFIDAHDPVIAANGKVDWFDGQDLYGFDHLLELAARLKPKHPRVGIVVCFWDHKPADEARLSELRRLARAAGVGDHILFHTEPGLFVPVLAQADVFVRPTNTDGDANSVREALYMGIPAVASDVVERPPGTILFRCRDSDDLVAKVEQALESTPDAAIDSSQSMKHSTDSKLNAYMDFLVSIIAESNRDS